MKIKPTLKFIMKHMVTSIGAFFGITLIMSLLGLLIFRTSGSEGTFNSGGSFSVSILTMVWGMMIFITYLKTFLQNGVSRKTIFASASISLVIACLACSALDFTLNQIYVKLGNPSISIYEILYSGNGFEATGALTFADFPMASLWSAVLFLVLAFFGALTAIIFYRIPKLWKILLGSILGALLFIGLPIWASMSSVNIFITLLQIFAKLFGLSNPFAPNPMVWVGYGLGISAVLASLCFLLYRKISPNKA